MTAHALAHSLSEVDRRWVEETRDGMTIDEQIAQLFVLSTRYDTDEEAAALVKLKPGGVHRFPTARLDRALAATRRVVEDAAVPPIISGDIEGGTVSYPFATPVPNQLGIAACDDLILSERIANVIARESRALGYNWSFTPVVDINYAFRNPVVGTRSYGSNVDAVLAQARTYVRVLQEHGIAATAKHWPGDGVDERDQHLATSVNSQTFETWEESFGRIYRTLIDDGVMTIMSAHIALPAFVRKILPDAGREAFRPASVSRLLNETLLRERLGFEGLIVSDATVMGGLTSWTDRAEAVPAVIASGCDAFLFSRDPLADMAFMRDGLRDGRLSEARLHEAVTRMLTLKARLGLHRISPGERIAPMDQVEMALRTPDHRATAQEAAGRSLTLVKDTRQLLPIDAVRYRRVVVIVDQGFNFFSGARDRDLDPFRDEMAARGFAVRPFDPDAMPTRDDTDLVIYLIGQEAIPSIANIYLDFARLHGSSRNAMIQFNQELPTLLISFGQPYFLFDAPNHQTYVNAYCLLADTQRELVRRLVGEASFTGRSPIDAFCGREQLRW